MSGASPSDLHLGVTGRRVSNVCPVGQFLGHDREGELKPRWASYFGSVLESSLRVETSVGYIIS